MPDSSDRQLRRLLQMTSGGEPHGLRDGQFVALPFGRPIHQGTSVPALASPYQLHSTGLWVPGSVRAPVPMDQVFAYATASDVFGEPVPVDLLNEYFAQLGTVQVLKWCAELLNVMERPGHDEHAFDRDCAERWFAGEALDRARALVADPRRRLVAPQVVMVAAKLAVLANQPPSAPQRFGPFLPFIALLFGLAEYLNVGTEDEGDLAGMPAALTRSLVANQHFYRSSDLALDVARHHRSWHGLMDELAEEGYPPLRELFHEATGVPLIDFEATGWGAWAGALAHGPVMPRSYFDPVGLAQPRVGAALDLLSADLPTLSTKMHEDFEAHGLEWSISPFEQFPLIRLDPDTLLIMSPRLLMRRVFGGLAYFDIDAYVQSQQAVKRGTLRTTYGRLAERYASDVIRGLAPDFGAHRRLYWEKDLRQAWPSYRGKLCDAALLYGDAWVLIEITSHRLTRASVAGSSGDALEQDLRRAVVEKAGQLDATIRQMGEGETALLGEGTAPPRLYYPVVVVTDGLPLNPLVLLSLRELVAQAGYLTGERIQPLEVLELTELEMVEGLQEMSGPSLKDLLAAKQRASMSRASLKDYLLLERRLQPPRPKRVKKLWKAASAQALKQLEFPSD